MKTNFGLSLKRDLVLGGTIIYFKEGEYNSAVLVRLPKGKYHVDNDIEFEYTLHEQHFTCSALGKETNHISSFNYTKRQAIKKAEAEYYDEWYHAKEQAKKKTNDE